MEIDCLTGFIFLLQVILYTYDITAGVICVIFCFVEDCFSMWNLFWNMSCL